MITNLMATIIVSVVTNWTDVYEQVPFWQSTPHEFYLNSVTSTFCANNDFLNTVYVPPPTKNSKYLGKDGIVVRVTEIKFDYDGKPQVHRIEEPLEKIIMRCHDKEPERIWDEPKREKLK